jgi:hypothetical protein
LPFDTWGLFELRAEQQEEAAALGRRLYAEKPKGFVGRP